MGNKLIELKVKPNYSENQLYEIIKKHIQLTSFNYFISNKSLDARNKSNIHWVLQVLIDSPDIKEKTVQDFVALEIPFIKKNKKVLVVGNGPAGFFAAYVLQKAGFNVTIIDRGSDVDKRALGIDKFEKSGIYSKYANYAFGEGGAGTFSDGKLTSRSKHITAERNFIINEYISAGAPAEIAYMAHPHIGSDNLRIIVKNLRKSFENLGGKVCFETSVEMINKENNRTIHSINTNNGSFDADIFILAPGHSSFDLYRMLDSIGVLFRPKGFAIGYRTEHPQAIINKAQWGKEYLEGVKAAEYRLTSSADGQMSVYTFCMCPGGIVVPAATTEKTNIVNGMSNYKRDGQFANAGIVCSIQPELLKGSTCSAMQALDELEKLEESFYNAVNGFSAPFSTIESFINEKENSRLIKSSYPLGLKAMPLWEMLPKEVVKSIQRGLTDFNRKIQGFNQGILLGLESKTSSPIQVLRNENALCDGFDNLYMVGEGSGYAGGIISSAADGVKMAMKLV